MKHSSNRTFWIVAFFWLAFLTAYSGCWETNKIHSASFDGKFTFAQESKPLELNASALRITSPNEEVCQLLRDSFKKLEGLSVEDRALASADMGIVAALANDIPMATKALDYGLDISEHITVAGVREKKATSLHGSESDKVFKGEPHERVVVYLYRGLLYIAQNDYENAQACFKIASMQDALAMNKEERSNWLTADMLELVSKKLMRDTDEQAFKQYVIKKYDSHMQEIEPMLNIEPPTFFVMIAVGPPPEKLASKSRGQKLSYLGKPSYVHSVRLITNEGPLEMVETDDIYIQAMTRGRRKMDDILSKKAQARKNIEGVDNVAAALAPLSGPGAIVLGIVKEWSWSASDKIDSAADCRQIRGLSRKLYLFVGDSTKMGGQVKIQALAENEKVLAEKTLAIQASNSAPVVILGHVPY